ncbi:unnamed protein product [Nezara viridula]|uniref:Uncharacterized protein n=1 Tax=Nezara viridula TaxID=85310 RepID=A0A9P0HII7_NEZVI|nr:unnamed protein product [Nezara viridula]
MPSLRPALLKAGCMTVLDGALAPNATLATTRSASAEIRNELSPGSNRPSLSSLTYLALASPMHHPLQPQHTICIIR